MQLFRRLNRLTYSNNLFHQWVLHEEIYLKPSKPKAFLYSCPPNLSHICAQDVDAQQM